MSEDPPKYSRLEHERRWLILGDGPDLSQARGRLIEDLYLEGGRLRLRRAIFDDGRTELKLCKKYGSDDPLSQPIVNIYLAEAEYRALRLLPGDPLIKRRYSVPPFGVDVFEGALSGLRLCEAEADTHEGLASVPSPSWLGPEVTGDPRFSGGSLVRISFGDLCEAMDELRTQAKSEPSSTRRL